jgi:MarR family transcriptional regulator, lower aerobic nicotinate degradation pathway regulator
MQSKTTGPSDSSQESGLLEVPVFALAQLGKLAHATVHNTFADAEVQGMSARTYFVLRCLHEDGQMSQRELADRTSIDRSDLVKLLDRLEDSGHLRRAADPRDRRRHVLSVTPAGTAVVEQGRQLLQDACDEVLDGLDSRERATLQRLVRRALTAGRIAEVDPQHVGRR